MGGNGTVLQGDVKYKLLFLNKYYGFLVVTFQI